MGNNETKINVIFLGNVETRIFRRGLYSQTT